MCMKEISDFKKMKYKLLLFYFLFIDFTERKGREGRRTEKEKEKHQFLFFYLCTHSLVDSSMCVERELNPQPWNIGTTL